MRRRCVHQLVADQRPAVVGVSIWLAACGAGAVLLIAVPTRFGRAASLGLAAGLLFADGDISAKLAGYGGWWLIAIGTLIVAYAVGTSVLQWAYQRGDALTAAGLATMATNAVPIAAGFVLFGETHQAGPGERSRTWSAKKASTRCQELAAAAGS